MKQSKIIIYSCVTISLIIAVIFYYNFYPENFINYNKTPITLNDIEKDILGEFIGKQAGEDIPRLSGKKEFESLYNYATLEPKSIIPTGIFILKPWVNSYRRLNRSTKRKPQIITSNLDILDEYIEYYLAECPDGTYILTQMPYSCVKQIKKGSQITLPVGKKIALPSKAASYLKNICEKYDVSLKGVMYFFDNNWYKKHDFTLFIIRFGVSIIVLFAAAACFIIISKRILHKTS